MAYETIFGRLVKVSKFKKKDPFAHFDFHDIPARGIEEDPPIKADKGNYQGSCNVRRCQQPGAIYYNHAMSKYYCVHCARDINRANRDWAVPQYGHQLCTEGYHGPAI